MHHTGQDMLWLIGSLSRIFRLPFDPQLIRQQFPPPYSRVAVLNALQALDFKVGERNLDNKTLASLEQLPFPAVAFLRTPPAEPLPDKPDTEQEVHSAKPDDAEQEEAEEAPVLTVPVLLIKANHMGISLADATPYQAPQPIAQPQAPTPVMPTTTRDIIGDAQKAEFTNTLAAGTVIDPTWKWDILHVQENAHDENRTDANGNPYTVRIVDSHTYTYNQRDDLDNWILDQTQPDPTRADILNDGSGNDRILAGGGYNTIYATHGGDNLIEAGDGGNTITAGSGNDSIITGSGNDSINAGAGDNTIAAGDGYNTITSGTGNDIIEGGANSDSIDAGAGDNTILAADGNNTLISGKGNDTILTGKDVDTINAGEGNNYINAGDGINTVTTGDGNDTLLTGKDNDIIHAGSGDNYVDAGAGRDIVDASATGLTPGVDPTQAKSILIGGADADILTGGAGEDKLYADSAIDTALAIAQGETQTGLTDQGDWLAGGAGDGRMRRRIRAANDAKHAIPPEWRIAA